jgi:transcriptional regulator with XRE-family HTH domain
MGSGKWLDERFGGRVRSERESRGWSQADMARMLSDRGIQPMHPTTVAKIEAGDRSVRINEAVGIADLFEVPVDSLLGRAPGAQRRQRAYLLRAFRDTARQSSQQVWAAMEAIHERLDELPRFRQADMLRVRGNDTCANRLYPAYEALVALVDMSEELLDREQGERELAERPLGIPPSMAVVRVPPDAEAQP